MAKWVVMTKRADFDSIGKKFAISPVLARLIRNRDIIEEDDIRKFLTGTAEELYDPFLLKDMEKTVRILAEKIASGAAIRVIGDYDADGICATHILIKGITSLGGRADTVIPHRIKDGYGLNDHLIADAARDGIDTIITCDNGIAAAQPIQAAKAMGMTVIVTDHHEVPFEEGEDGKLVYFLPAADAVVDPKQEGCPYPCKQICGGVVAAKVVEALFHFMGRVIPAVLQEEIRCLGAFATICDVMELRDENRILVKYGLDRMRRSANLGLRALIEVNGISEERLSPYHVGFVLGPCINATGRLDTAERALALLGATDYREAMVLAADLKNLNESRKEMTRAMVEEAVHMVVSGSGKQGQVYQEYQSDKVLVLYLPHCHESLAGIVAGRVREHFGKPAFVLTDAEEEVKGSGRSIEAYDMYAEMCKCKELFIKFGGHKQAAGLSIKKENIGRLRQLLNDNAVLTEEDFEENIRIDIAMPLSYVSTELIRELDRLAPFGNGNTKPVFAQKQIRLIRGSVMGKNRNVGKYTIADGDDRRFEMIYFGDVEAFHEFLAGRYSQEEVRRLYEGGASVPMEISIAYYPDINTYKGKENIQIVMRSYC